MLIGLAGILLVIGILSVGTIILARWMLTPLLKAARTPAPKTQFFLSDMYVLFLQFALVGLINATMRGRGGREVDMVLFLALCWLALGLVWIVGVRILSRAAVRGALPRAISLGLTIPGAYVSALVFWVFLAPAMVSGAMGLISLAGGYGVVFVVALALARWAAGSAEKNVEPPAAGTAAQAAEKPPDDTRGQ
ncbi:MAG: hypothetical protein NTW87_16780 [Planctomycetota bacterium]|nr:hypothetical protein [Planctomycetota bacterium]